MASRTGPKRLTRRGRFCSYSPLLWRTRAAHDVLVVGGGLHRATGGQLWALRVMAILFALAALLALSVVVRAYAAARPSAKRRIDSSSSAIYTTARRAGIKHDLLELTSAATVHQLALQLKATSKISWVEHAPAPSGTNQPGPRRRGHVRGCPTRAVAVRASRRPAGTASRSSGIDLLTRVDPQLAGHPLRRLITASSGNGVASSGTVTSPSSKPSTLVEVACHRATTSSGKGGPIGTT